MTPPKPRRLDELPAIDPGTVAIVRTSCARLPKDLTALTHEFYRQLFTMAPQARMMFPEDMTAQSEKLLKALLAAVQHLDRPEQVEGFLRQLGYHHRRRYAVTDEQYVYVGHALVRALARLSGHLESSVGSAWVAVYEWLAAVMIDGADAADRAQGESVGYRSVADGHQPAPEPAAAQTPEGWWQPSPDAPAQQETGQEPVRTGRHGWT